MLLSLLGTTGGPRLYAVVYSSALSPPSAAQIKLGQDVNGNPATWASSVNAPSATTTYDWPSLATGLTAGQSYKVSFVWSDGANDSLPETSASFTTTAGTGAFTLDAAAGSYGATGAAADLLADRALDAAAGAYAATGAAADLLAGRALDAEAGLYQIDGYVAGTIAQRELDAAAGTYALTGADAELVGPSTGFSLDAQAGSYGATGASADLIAALSLSADAGAYAATGADAALEAGRALSADAGAYTATGAAADVLAARALDAEAGAYALTGADADLNISGQYALSADAGVYGLSGADATLLGPSREGERVAGGIEPRRARYRVRVGRRWVEVDPLDPVSVQRAYQLAEQVGQDAAAERVVNPRKSAVRAVVAKPAQEAEGVDYVALRDEARRVSEMVRRVYAESLQRELIGRLMRERAERDEDDAVAALLLS